MRTYNAWMLLVAILLAQPLGLTRASAEGLSAVEAVSHSDVAGDAESLEKEDLLAQQSMASSTYQMMVAAWLSLGIGGFGLIGLAVTVIYTRQAAASGREAVAEARTATRIAYESLSITRDNAQKELRAYIFVKSCMVTGVEEDRITITTSYRNTGNTPAYNLQIWTEYYVIEPDFSIVDPEEPVWSTVGSVEPQGEKNRISWYDREQSQGIRSEIGNNGKIIVTSGQIRYEDVFGVRHRIAFRYFTSARPLEDHGFSISEIGNGVIE